MHAALSVGKAHFEQCGYQSAGADVVTCHYPTAVYQLLNGVEGVAEILGIFHRGDIVAHLAETLCECASAEALLVEREVYVVDGCVLVVHHYGRYHLADVAYLAAGTHDDRSRGNDLVAVGILLGHGERVFTGRHIHLYGAAEVGKGLDSTVKAGVLALLRAAGPHPVGREAEAVHAFRERCPHDVGKSLGHG